MAKIIPAAAKTNDPPCPHCGASKGRTFLSEERVGSGTGSNTEVLLWSVISRRYRCYGCGKTYHERQET